MRSRRALPLALAALSYALALTQRPGELVADTKVDLHLDPARFLGDVTSVWSPTTDLGHVWAGQYGGYLWPMAPWFAAGHALGLPMWLVQRLWLGTLLALAAWGVVRLLDALLQRRRGPVHAAAAVLFVVNPYVTTYAGRQSIALLAYAALPWMLLCVHRGLRDPGGWRWPAALALVLTSAGGGVNAAVTAWVLAGPALLVLYEVTVGGVPGAALRRWLLRAVPLAVLASAWWVVPVALAGRGAPNFLPFTEQPGTIWATTSLSESLRLMGFWASYVGVGYGGVLRPYQGSAPALLLLVPVVVASLLVPAAAIGTFPWTRRWRYAPFFLLLALAGLVIMAAGWPDGTPLRRAATGAYYRVDTLQALRTTYKAGALVALGLAVLGGAAFGLAWARWPRAVVAAGGAALVALASWPLVTGRAVERQLAFDLPQRWRAVAADLDREPDRTRAMVLPGQLFASYRWGGTVDPVLPALARRPVVTRWIVPFADGRSTELQFAVDGLVTQERLRPGQLPALLDLLGVGDVVVAADGDRSRSAEMPAGDAARLLDAQLPGGRAYGPRLTAEPAAGELAAPRRVPALRRVPVRTGGLVRVLPGAPLTIVDGAAGGLVGLAAYGALQPGRPIVYAPDLTAAALRAAARAGATVVISDTDRRRAFVAARAKGDVGPTLTERLGVPADGVMLDPFGDLDARAQTVAVLRGVRDVSAPASPQITQHPEQRPFAALDGDLATAWLADRALVPSRHVLTVDLGRPRDLPAIDLYPYSDSRAVVRAVTVEGRRFRVHRGWNRLALGLRGVRRLDVAIAAVTRPRHAPGGAGGIRELRIPGVRASEALRPPVVAAEALRGADLSRVGLTYLLERAAADVPFRASRYAGERGAEQLRDARDGEARLVRVLDPPAPRSYRVDGWASVDPRTPDDVLDRLAGTRGGPVATSSSRFDGLGRYRASGAFDGAGRAWIGQWIAGRPAWLAWRTARPRTVRRLVLDPAPVRVRRPTRVRLTVDGTPGPALAVGAGGAVALPAAVRGRAFRLDVLGARFAAGTPGRDRRRRAVGIGEVRGAGAGRAAVPRTGTVALACGSASLRAGAEVVGLGGRVRRAALDAGRPLRLRGCGRLRLAARGVTVTGSTAPLRLDGVRLDARAPVPVAPTGGGRVLDAGHGGRGRRDGVRVAVSGPSWLVLGESYDRHWRATCDGRDLGAPRPMQGYANGWPVTAACHAVRFRYAPQALATAGYGISALVCLALLLVLLLAARRPAPDPVRTPLPAPRVVPLAARRALLAAAPAAAAIAVGFGLRAGAVVLPLLALALWRGVGDRALGVGAGLALAVGVPTVYLVVAAQHRGEALGGDATQYAADRLTAHWLALAALIAVALVLWRTLAAAGRGSPGSPAGREVPSRAVTPDPDPSLR